MWRSIVLFLARGWTFPSSVTWNAVKNMDANYDTWDVPYKLLFFPPSVRVSNKPFCLRFFSIK